MILPKEPADYGRDRDRNGPGLDADLPRRKIGVELKKMDRLRVVPPHGNSFLHTVERQPVVIGRSATADIHVPDRYLSRRHARLFRQQEAWWIEDLASRNGSWINGRRIDCPMLFGPEDRVRLSNTHLYFASEPEEPEPTPTDIITASHDVAFRPVHELIERVRSLDPFGLDPTETIIRQTEQLHLLNQFHNLLNQPLDLDSLLELVLDQLFGALQADQGVIYLTQEGGRPQRAAERSTGGLTTEHLESQTLLAKVVDQGMTALVNGPASPADWQSGEELLEHGVRSLVAAPLIDSQGTLGMIAMSSNRPESSFGEQEQELLVSLATAAALRIRNMLLVEEAAREAAELERLDQELVLARRIQVGILPAEIPRLEGFELRGSSIPCRRVSGDFYQMIPRDSGNEVVVLVADVVGKGLGASLVTASLEALASGPIEAGHPPGEICRRLDRRLHARTSSGKFSAMFIASIRANEDQFTYANAGLNPALLVKASGRAYQLPASGPPLGLLLGADYGESSRRLKEGDLLVIYTDGISEAVNAADEEYGLRRLTSVCRRHRRKSLEEIAAAIESALEDFVDGFPYDDDRTLVLVRRTL